MAGVLPRRDGHSSGTPVAGRLEQPTRATRPTDEAPPAPEGASASLLFGLAPGGACRAADVAACAVRSCRTLSPLPMRRTLRPSPGGLLSVALSLGSPPPDVIRRRIRMEPGLSSASERRPSGRLAEPAYGREAAPVKEKRAAPPAPGLARAKRTTATPPIVHCADGAA